MSRMHRFALPAVVALLSLRAAAAGAQTAAGSPPDSATMAAARAMVESSGMIEAMIATMRAAVPAQRAATPQLPDEFWTRFEDRLVKDAPQLADSIAGVYAGNFTRGQLDSLTAFYRSPTGQRLRELQPLVITQASAIGQRWGMRIGAEIGATLKPE